jgi:hypothetical protein
MVTSAITTAITVAGYVKTITVTVIVPYRQPEQTHTKEMTELETNSGK